MARLMLNDELWSKLREIMRQHRIYDKPNLRMIVEAMLCRMRVHFRAIATRDDKLKRNYASMLAMAYSYFGYLCESFIAFDKLSIQSNTARTLSLMFTANIRIKEAR